MADLINVRDLKVYLDVDAGTVKAVDGVSFRIPAGRTVALVGESGSGKSVVAQSIMSILPRIARIEGGEIVFRDGSREVDISRLDRKLLVSNRDALVMTRRLAAEEGIFAGVSSGAVIHVCAPPIEADHRLL